MVLASMGHWDIVDISEKVQFSNVDPKMLKVFQKCVKMTMSIINLNLADNQLAYIKNCKGPTEAWNILCNIHETKNLSNILFIHSNFFTRKMQKDEDLLDHINKVKTLVD